MKFILSNWNGFEIDSSEYAASVGYFGIEGNPTILLQQFLTSDYIDEPKELPSQYLLTKLKEAIEIAQSDFSAIDGDYKSVNSFLKQVMEQVEYFQSIEKNSGVFIAICNLINKFLETFLYLRYHFLDCTVNFYVKGEFQYSGDYDISFLLSVVGFHPIVYETFANEQTRNKILGDIISQGKGRKIIYDFYKEHGPGKTLEEKIDFIFKVGRALELYKKVPEKRYPMKDFVRNIEDIINSHADVVDSLPVKELILIYDKRPQGYHFRKKTADLSNYHHNDGYDSSWGLEEGENYTKTKDAIERYLGLIEADLNQQNFSYVVLKILYQIYTSSDFYNQPAILFGHALQWIQPPNLKFNSSYIEETIQILDELMKGFYTKFNQDFNKLVGIAHWIDYEPLHGDSLDLFVALLATKWLIIGDQENTNYHLGKLKAFYEDYVKQIEVNHKYNQYLKSTQIKRCNEVFSTCAIFADFVPKKITDQTELDGEFSSEELIRKFNAIKDEEKKLAFLFELISKKGIDLKELLFIAAKDKNDKIANEAVKTLIKKKIEPETLEEKIIYSIWSMDWKQVLSEADEKTGELLLKILKGKHDELTINEDNKLVFFREIGSSNNPLLIGIAIEQLDTYSEPSSHRDTLLISMGKLGKDHVQAKDFLIKLFNKDKGSADSSKLIEAMVLTESDEVFEILKNELENNSENTLAIVGLLDSFDKEEVISIMEEQFDKTDDNKVRNQILQTISRMKKTEDLKGVQNIIKKLIKIHSKDYREYDKLSNDEKRNKKWTFPSKDSDLNFLQNLIENEQFDLIKFYFKNASKDITKIVLPNFFYSLRDWRYDQKNLDFIFELDESLKGNEKVQVGIFLARWVKENRDKNYEKVKWYLIDMMYELNDINLMRDLYNEIGELYDADFVPAMSHGLLRNGVDPSKNPRNQSFIAQSLIRCYAKAYRSRRDYQNNPSCNYCKDKTDCDNPNKF